MDSKTARAKLDQWYKALNTADFKVLAAVMTEIGDVEIEVEYPQSGEKIRGRENNLAVLENYPGLPAATVKEMHGAEDKWVLTPSWPPLRLPGTADNYVFEGRLAFPNDKFWTYEDLPRFR